MQQLPTMKTQLLFDLESTGLLRQGSRIHCIVVRDGDTGDTSVFDHKPERDLLQGVKQLEQADALIGHNIIGYDIPVIKKFYPWFERPYVIDTLLLSRLYHPNLMETDKKHQWHLMPLQLYGRHSLEAYGYRLKEYKGCFSKDTDWREWSDEMEQYMVQDVKVTTKLCKHFTRYLTGSI